MGQLGDTSVLAAAALGSTLSSMSGKVLLMGLCGAVDTLASQASGAGQAVGPIFQRAVLFLAVHWCERAPGLYVAAGLCVCVCARAKRAERSVRW